MWKEKGEYNWEVGHVILSWWDVTAWLRTGFSRSQSLWEFYDIQFCAHVWHVVQIFASLSRISLTLGDYCGQKFMILQQLKKSEFGRHWNELKLKKDFEWAFAPAPVLQVWWKSADFLVFWCHVVACRTVSHVCIFMATNTEAALVMFDLAFAQLHRCCSWILLKRHKQTSLWLKGYILSFR